MNVHENPRELEGAWGEEAQKGVSWQVVEGSEGGRHHPPRMDRVLTETLPEDVVCTLCPATNRCVSPLTPAWLPERSAASMKASDCFWYGLNSIELHNPAGSFSSTG